MASDSRIEGLSQPLDIGALAKLRSDLNSIQATHVRTMESYISDDQQGFCHLLTNTKEASVASSATCLASLVATGKWLEVELPSGEEPAGDTKSPKPKLSSKTEAIAEFLLTKRNSADLGEDNPFTLSFIAEGLFNLGTKSGGYSEAQKHKKTLEKDVLEKIRKSLESRDAWTEKGATEETKAAAVDAGAEGAVAIFPYPPSGYLTQLAYRVLRLWDFSSAKIDDLVHSWSLAEINKQVALITAGSRAADPMQLAYALIAAIDSHPDRAEKPEEKEIFAHALKTFFQTQRADGGWPLSRPMFHYRKVGNAYCFEYELLTQLLQRDLLLDQLIRYLPELSLAAKALESTKFDLDSARGREKVGWASGHHPQLPGPESWSTASVYHFAHVLNRVVAEAIRIELFRELGREYKGPPGTPETPPGDNSLKDFAEDFLDAEVRPVGSEPRSLREVLATKFVYPLARNAKLVRQGQSLPKKTAMSAILFGPPGTSKTTLAKIISDYLKWPRLEVDPSYVVKDGLDRVQAMANKLFSMLEISEEVVVLLDEFDEMGRDRSANQDLLSRFITTAMLPKLASINHQRRIVFLLATNYVSDFDAAFSRSGRFDIMLQVMPPTAAAKKGKWKILDEKLKLLGSQKIEVAEGQQLDADEMLTDLTYDEAEALAEKLEEAPDAAAVKLELQAVYSSCTLSKTNRAAKSVAANGGETPPAEDGDTWKDSCIKDRTKIRLR